MEKESEIFNMKFSAYLEMCDREFQICTSKADLASYMESGRRY